MSAAGRARERRTADRRNALHRPAGDESWFGGSGPSESGLPEPEHDTGWTPSATSTEPPRDSGFVSRPAEPQVSSGQAAFDRIYRAFLAARAALGVALGITLGVVGLFGLRPTVPVVLISLAYSALALSMWLLPRFHRAGAPQAMARLRSPQWIATIGADLVCFTALHILAPGSSLNYVALLVLPVLMAGVLTPRMMALATAAAVTLALLAAAWLAVLAGGDATLLMTQAGLAGSGFFVITVLASEMASRLAREELSARDSLEMARQQTELNRLVIEEMQDGVLVVDRRGRVRAANPAARRLLMPSGLSRPAPFQLRAVQAWQALVETVEKAFSGGLWSEAGRDVALSFDGGLSRTLRVRIRFTRKGDGPASEELCVLFLEDVRNMQARSRQEKLAAMGRISAGIAHEIRNPLAAIAQANALLSEDAADPTQRRLTRMVGENVERLKRIVDDVMEVAPGPVQDGPAIDLVAHVGQVCSEWARSVGLPLGEHSVLKVELPAEPIGALFDAEHLRRVLVNLLDNAQRHGSGQPGSVLMRVDSRDAVRAFLSVASDGEPIPADVERHLFEPFFSTRSRGTGLGLYICRELCERYGASIDYRPRAPADSHRNEFFVVMRRAPLMTSEAGLHLSP